MRSFLFALFEPARSLTAAFCFSPAIRSDGNESASWDGCCHVAHSRLSSDVMPLFQRVNATAGANEMRSSSSRA